MKENIKKGIVILTVAVLLVAAYWWGGNSPLLHGWEVQNEEHASVEHIQDESTSNTGQTEGSPSSSAAPQQPADEQTAQTESADSQNTLSVPTSIPTPPADGMSAEEKIEAANQIAQAAGKEFRGQFYDGPAPEGKPQPVEQDQQTVTDVQGYCTLSVSCESLLSHMDWLPEEKWELVPADGVIFPATQVVFYQGESVFHVLRRELKKAGIHLEFTNVPVFGSAYIEGINNLYEFDCGELSGWMYSVNGWFPNYGCSRYQIQEGDVIQWMYSCELGVDIGG